MKKLIERKNIQNIDDHITKSLCVCVRNAYRIQMEKE